MFVGWQAVVRTDGLQSQFSHTLCLLGLGGTTKGKRWEFDWAQGRKNEAEKTWSWAQKENRGILVFYYLHTACKWANCLAFNLQDLTEQLTRANNDAAQQKSSYEQELLGHRQRNQVCHQNFDQMCVFITKLLVLFCRNWWLNLKLLKRGLKLWRKNKVSMSSKIIKNIYIQIICF